MYNWNIDKHWLKKQHPIWHLNQLINFGLNKEKIDFAALKKHWKNLIIDPKRKKFLRYLLWGKLS